MSSEAARNLVVKCPACKAVTKVSGVPEGKETITCPKCQRPVPLSGAKPLAKPAGAEPRTSLPQPTSEDYQRTYKGKSSRRGNKLWIGMAIGVGFGLFVLAVVLTLQYVGEKKPAPESAHVKLLKELNELYGKAIDEMDRLKMPGEVAAFNSRHAPVIDQLQEMNNRYGTLPVADRVDRDEILRLESELLISKRRYQDGRQRVAKLLEGMDLRPSAPSLSSAPSIPAAPTSSRTASPEATRSQQVITSLDGGAGGAAPPPSQPAPAATAAEKDKVTLTILNLAKEKATKEFLARVQLMAGGRARIVNRQWAGDLLLLELAPVADIDRFAARLNFGQVTQLDKTHRAITLLVRAEAVGADGALPELPTDPFDAALADLQSKEPEKRRKGALDLLQMKPGENKPEAMQALLLALAEKDPQTKLNVLRALARWGGPEAVDPLLTQLSDESVQVRRTALDLLGQLRDPKAAEAIARECIVKDREAAGAALQALGPKAEPAVLPLLKHEATEVRVEACRILRRIGTRAAVPELLKVAGEPKSPVTEAAWEAIEGISSRRGG